MSETVLIVDDEDSVRRTFQEWLDRSGLDCRVLTAADAESALQHANRQPIDLAILDWNLGSGSGALLVRYAGADAESYHAYGADGQPLAGPLVPFAQSIAATAVSMQEPCAMGRDELAGVTPQPFERGRASLLAAPLTVGPGLCAV